MLFEDIMKPSGENMRRFIFDNIDLENTETETLESETPIFYSNLSIASMIKRSEIPLKQKQIASNYMTIKKIYGFFSVPSRITNVEKSLLSEYDFLPLEFTSYNKMAQELETLKEMSKTYNEKISKDSDKIFEIRVKELKYLYASNYFPQDEFCDGWRALEEYISYIA